nr:ATP-binding protein [Nocardioides sp. IC4_145]
MGSAAVARRALATELEDAGFTRQEVEDVALVLTEMLHNAVAHGRPLPTGVVEVQWTLTRELLRIAVRDGGHVEALHPLHPTDTEPGGRGLLMIEGLASRWTVPTGVATTLVVAEFDRTTSASPCT